MFEFEVEGQAYRSGKMNAKTQFHVMRRMAPIVGPLQALTSGDGGAIVKVAEGIGTLSDEAADYIVDHCLAVVHRKQGEAWAAVQPPGTAGIMFADIDLWAMLLITSNVLRDNYDKLFQKGLALIQKGEAKDSAA